MKNNILIIGSGWVANGFLKNIDYEKYNITLVSQSEMFLQQPNFSLFLNDDDVIIEQNLKSKFPKIQYICDTIENVKLKNQEVSSSTNTYNYDYVVFCYGSVSNDYNINGIKENCYSIKTKNDIVSLKKVIEDLQENSIVAVLGCGLTGSEIIGQLIDMNKFQVVAIDGLPGPLNTFNTYLQEYTRNIWSKYGISTYFNSFVKKVNKNEILLTNDKRVKYDIAIWCGGIKKSPLTDTINKHICTNNKFGIPVNEKLQLENYSNAFAAGDCAHSGFPPTAQNAYQQGIYLANQFNSNFTVDKFKPNNKGQVCYVGKNNAIYQHNDFYLSGVTGFLAMKVVKFYMKFI